jgi:hypothetical protein
MTAIGGKRGFFSQDRSPADWGAAANITGLRSFAESSEPT